MIPDKVGGDVSDIQNGCDDDDEKEKSKSRMKEVKYQLHNIFLV
jgi:hypothetical protein